MSKIALSGNASGTGTLTIAAPNTNSDRILNLPDSAGTLATAESTLTQFNASGSAPVYAARAWVNFNGTGTVAIRSSGNVSSIVDNGVGDYTVNFTTAMSDVDYAAFAGQSTAADRSQNFIDTLTTSVRVRNTISSTAVFADATAMFVAVLR
jgi:hypothetical protein